MDLTTTTETTTAVTSPVSSATLTTTAAATLLFDDAPARANKTSFASDDDEILLLHHHQQQQGNRGGGAQLTTTTTMPAQQQPQRAEAGGGPDEAQMQMQTQTTIHDHRPPPSPPPPYHPSAVADIYQGGKCDSGPRAFARSLSLVVSPSSSSSSSSDDGAGNGPPYCAASSSSADPVLLFNAGLDRHLRGNDADALILYLRGAREWSRADAADEQQQGTKRKKSGGGDAESSSSNSKMPRSAASGVGYRLLNNAGCILYRRGNIDEALTLFERAAALSSREEWDAISDDEAEDAEDDDEVYEDMEQDDDATMTMDHQQRRQSFASASSRAAAASSSFRSSVASASASAGAGAGGGNGGEEKKTRHFLSPAHDPAGMIAEAQFAVAAAASVSGEAPEAAGASSCSTSTTNQTMDGGVEASEERALNQAAILSNVGRCQYTLLKREKRQKQKQWGRQQKVAGGGTTEAPPPSHGGGDNESIFYNESSNKKKICPNKLASTCLDVYDARSAVLPPEHPDVAAASYNLGLAEMEQGLHDEASHCFHEYIEISDVQAMEEHQGASCSSSGSVSGGDTTDAVPSSALQKQRQWQPPPRPSNQFDPIPAIVHILLCSLYPKVCNGGSGFGHEAGDRAARQLHDSLEYLQHLRETYGPYDPSVADALADVASTLYDARVLNYAGKFLEEALRIRRHDRDRRGNQGQGQGQQGQQGAYFSPSSEPCLWHKLGNVRREQSRIMEAMGCYGRALVSIDDSSSSSFLAVALFSSASNGGDGGVPSEAAAAASAEAAYARARALEAEAASLRADVHRDAATLQEKAGTYESTLVCHRASLSCAREAAAVAIDPLTQQSSSSGSVDTRYLEGLAYQLVTVGQFQMDRGDVSDAAQSFMEASGLYCGCFDSHHAASASADASSSGGTRHFTLAVAFADAAHRLTSAVLNGGGTAYEGYCGPAEAERACLIALDRYRQCLTTAATTAGAAGAPNDASALLPRDAAFVLTMDAGRLRQFMGRPAEALVHYRSCLSLAEGNDDLSEESELGGGDLALSRAMAVEALRAMASAYMRMGDREEAEKAWNEADERARAAMAANNAASAAAAAGSHASTGSTGVTAAMRWAAAVASSGSGGASASSSGSAPGSSSRGIPSIALAGDGPPPAPAA